MCFQFNTILLYHVRQSYDPVNAFLWRLSIDEMHMATKLTKSGLRLPNFMCQLDLAMGW